MPLNGLSFSDRPWRMFLSMMGGSLVLYFTLAGLSYLFIFVWQRRRLHPEYVADWRENGRAILWSQLSILGNVAANVPIHLLIARGHSRVYTSVAEHGVPYLIASAALVLVVAETLIYWIHRGLHWGPFFRLFHRHHHSFKQTTPWVSVAFHPLDSFAQASPYHLCAFLFPMHVGLYLLTTVLATVWSTSIHDRISLLRGPFVNHAAHHTIHHWYDNYNFGQYLTLWDRLGGTYRSPRELYAPNHAFLLGSSPRSSGFEIADVGQ